MKSTTTKKIAWWLILFTACIVCLASCKPFKQLANNQPVYTKKARIVPGNAKNFQLRKAAKEKKLQTKKLNRNEQTSN
jgi:hypothetical protein